MVGGGGGCGVWCVFLYLVLSYPCVGSALSCTNYNNLPTDRAAQKRQNERTRIRQIYVPELIIRLHYLLYSSRKHIPGSVYSSRSARLVLIFFFARFRRKYRNLKRAIELANIVADSRYRLYETFSGNGGRSLLDYLQVVRQAVLAGVENGGSDPFRIIAAL